VRAATKRRSYCRSSGDNLKIDSCALRREGRLCGRCQAGYSEAWFSTLCVPNDDCGPLWLYALTTTLGVMYALFLMFQADVKKFIFSGSLCRPAKNAQPTNSVDCYSNLPSTSPTPTFWSRQDKTTQRIELTKFEDYAAPSDYARLNHTSAQTTDDDESTNNGLLLFPVPVTSSSTSDFRRHPTDKPAQRQDGGTTTAADREPVEVSIAVDYGCIVILVYYLQDSQLLNVKTVYTSRQSPSS